MAIYVCIIFDQRTPLRTSAIEAENMAGAVTQANALCRKLLPCTTFQIWYNGRLIYQGRPLAAQ